MIAHPRLPYAQFPIAGKTETFYASTQTKGRVSSITTLLVPDMVKLSDVQNFRTNAEVLRELKVLHATYVCTNGLEYDQVVCLLASNSRFQEGDDSKNLFKEEDLLSSTSSSLSTTYHSNTAAPVDLKPSCTNIPVASAVHLSLRVAPHMCAVTADKLLRSLAILVRQVEFVYLDRKFGLRRRTHPWLAKFFLFFQVLKINGTSEASFGRRRLVFACDTHTRFIVHILGRQIEVEKAAVYSRQLPRFTDSTVQLRPRDISVLDNIHGVETSVVSFDELKLDKQLLRCKRSTIGMFREASLLCRPKQILVYNTVDGLTEQKILANHFRSNESITNIHDAHDIVQLERICRRLSCFVGSSRIQTTTRVLQTPPRPRLIISFKPKRARVRIQQPSACSINNFLDDKFAVLSKASNERENERKLLFWNRVTVHKKLGVDCEKQRNWKINSLSIKDKNAFCWEDIGGHTNAKRVLKDIFSFSHQSQELLNTKRNVLLFGPPGTGKTLIAKVVSAEIRAHFMDIKGPELLNMYVGESERAIRAVFREAEEKQPCLLFFDEMESIAPDRSHSSSMLARLASQVILEFDGSRSHSHVFIMGATNRPDMLDRSLLRPGRFDYLLYTGIGGSIHHLENLWEAATRRLSLSKEVDLRQVAHLCAPNSSGADIYGVCVRAWIRAARRTLSTRHDCILQTYRYPEVCINIDDIVACAVNMTASVCEEDVRMYDELYQEYDSGCKG